MIKIKTGLKILVVAYAFPPTGGAGVQRPVKFVKYLSRLGHKPFVLTVSNPSVPVTDESLCQDIPDNISVYRTKTLEPDYVFKSQLSSATHRSPQNFASKLKLWIAGVVKSILLPDLQVLWWPLTLSHMGRILGRESIDCIFVTAPPFSSLFFSSLVAHWKKIPIVVDFRDEWAFSRESMEHSVKNSFARWFDLMLERATLQLADGFTAATHSYVDGILQRHPCIHPSKGRAITNGYDEDDFVGLKRTPHEGAYLNIVYVGTVWHATSLRFYLRSLKQVLLEVPELKGKLKLHIIGRVLPEEQEYINDEEVKGIIKTYGYLPHKDVLQHILDADALLLTLSQVSGAEKIIPAKTFEYIASGQPILSFVPCGETYNLLEKDYANVFFCSDDNISDHQDFYFNLLDRLPGKTGYKSIPKFSRYELTKEMVQFMYDIIRT